MQIPNRFFTYLGQNCPACLIPPGSTGWAPVFLVTSLILPPPFQPYLHERGYGNESVGGPGPRGFGQLTAWQRGVDGTHPFWLLAALQGAPHNYQFYQIDLPCFCFFLWKAKVKHPRKIRLWSIWSVERCVIFLPYPNSFLVSRESNKMWHCARTDVRKLARVMSTWAGIPLSHSKSYHGT